MLKAPCEEKVCIETTDTEAVAREDSWRWMRNGYMKTAETEGMICAEPPLSNAASIRRTNLLCIDCAVYALRVCGIY